MNTCRGTLCRNREEGKEVLKLWRESLTMDALRQNRDSVHRYWNMWLQGVPVDERTSRLHKLAGFMAFYERHKENTMECFKTAQLDLADAAKRPHFNLAEVAHARMKVLGAYGDTLDEGVMFDVVMAVRQMASGELEEEGGQYTGIVFDNRNVVVRPRLSNWYVLLV